MTVWNLVKPGKRTLKLPFKGTPKIFVEGYTVVLFPSDTSYDPGPVVVWDTIQEDVRVIGSFRELWLAHFDANEELLVVFTRCDKNKPLQLEQTKWALSGQKLDTKPVRLSPSGRPLIWNDMENLTQWAQLYSREKVTELRAWSSNGDMLHVTYDRSMDKLSAQWVQNPKNLWQDSHQNGTGVLLTHSIVYGLVEARKLYIYNASEGAVTAIPYQRDVREISNNDKFQQLTFGDREVFGVVGLDGTQLWFFNPDFVINRTDNGAMDFVGMGK